MALIAFSVNLRASFIAVAPVSDLVRDDLGVSSSAIGFLTSLPVLCFGLAAPLALVAARRLGSEACVVLTLVAVVLGSTIRSVGPFWLALVGSVVIGLGITVGNVVAPTLIRREVPPSRVGLVTGIYVSAMNAGSMVVTLATVPLAQALGWRVALALWGLLAVAGLVVWLGVVGRPARGSGQPSSGGPDLAAQVAAHPTTSVWRSRIAWLLALALAAQTTSYYAVTAWLPTLLHDEIGLDPSRSGAFSSIFQVLAIVGALGVPALATRSPRWLPVALVGACWITLPVQLLMAPEAFVVGIVLGGIAQGGGISAVFTAVAQVSRSADESTRLSAFVQGVGYGVAALGPAALGLAHDATGDWTVPLLIVLATTSAFCVLGTLAALARIDGPARSSG